jgi:hypothetical protein
MNVTFLPVWKHSWVAFSTCFIRDDYLIDEWLV